MTTTVLTSDRLTIRGWTADDAESALGIYGSPEVARWLTPVMEQVDTIDAMRRTLEAWQQAQPDLIPPQGRWAVERNDDRAVIGGVSIRLLPPADDLELSWHLNPGAWAHGYATEAAGALVAWALAQDVDELFAVARPNNVRAIRTAQRLGMQWVGETTKYYGLRLQVYRIRTSDLSESTLN
ncbi:GNAT family N-acetyltransferase [Nocardia sp. NPDC049220]|uniref:GNAT family N-acetyltransferase n=1 Tax=Nocardia sp. NPDC049220 TaxID=3155273 RepID=UPI0033CA363C